MVLSEDEAQTLDDAFFGAIQRELSRESVVIQPGEYTVAQCQARLGYKSRDAMRTQLRRMVERGILRVRVLPNNTQVYSMAKEDDIMKRKE